MERVQTQNEKSQNINKRGRIRRTNTGRIKRSRTRQIRTVRIGRVRISRGSTYTFPNRLRINLAHHQQHLRNRDVTDLHHHGLLSRRSPAPPGRQQIRRNGGVGVGTGVPLRDAPVHPQGGGYGVAVPGDPRWWQLAVSGAGYRACSGRGVIFTGKTGTAYVSTRTQKEIWERVWLRREGFDRARKSHTSRRNALWVGSCHGVV